MEVKPTSVTPISAIKAVDSATEKSGQASPQAAKDAYHTDAQQVADAIERHEKLQETMSLLNFAPLSLPGPNDIRQFEEQFNKALQMAGIDTDQPIELQVNQDGSVSVANDHPQKLQIEALFKDSDLQQGLVRAQMAQTFAKLAALHEQWQQKIQGGQSVDSANLWLVNASQAVVAQESNVVFANGSISAQNPSGLAERASRLLQSVQAMS